MILIIGAGPIGIFIAGLLIDRGYKVKILESGDWEKESSFLNRNSYIFETKSTMPADVHRIGGGSNYWHARFGEFLSEDFLELSSMNLKGWPFTKDDLSEHYQSVVKEISDTVLSDDEFLEEKLSDLRCNLSTGLDLRLFRFAMDYSFQDKLKNLLKSENFELVTECHIDSISSNLESDTPSYICHATSNNGVTDLEAQSVIVCAGTLQATKIFLNSPKLHNEATFSIAGKGLMEHLEGFIGEIKIPRSHQALARKFKLTHNNKLKGLNAGVGIRLDSSINRSEELPSLHIELRPPPRILRLPKTLKISGAPNPLSYLERAYQGLLYYFSRMLDQLRHLETYGIYVKAEEFRNENSVLRLKSETSGAKLVYNHQVCPQTYEKFYAALELLLPKVNAMFNAKIDLYLWVKKQGRNQEFEANWHPMGTLPMGWDFTNSVCNPSLQVHFNPGIFILSPAVFNRGSNGNPTFTTLALASKLVKEKFAKQDFEPAS